MILDEYVNMKLLQQLAIEKPAKDPYLLQISISKKLEEKIGILMQQNNKRSFEQ